MSGLIQGKGTTVGSGFYELQEGSSTPLPTCASKRGIIEVAPISGLDMNDFLWVRGH